MDFDTCIAKLHLMKVEKQATDDEAYNALSFAIEALENMATMRKNMHSLMRRCRVGMAITCEQCTIIDCIARRLIMFSEEPKIVEGSFPVSYEKKKPIFLGDNPHDCESRYKCTYCGELFGDWDMFRQPDIKDVQKPYCPECHKTFDR